MRVIEGGGGREGKRLACETKFNACQYCSTGYGVTMQPGTLPLMNRAATSAFGLPISCGLENAMTCRETVTKDPRRAATHYSFC